MKIRTMVYTLKKLLASEQTYVNILKRGGVKIGENCIVDKTAEFGTEPYLISMGNNVRITKGVRFITHDGSLWVPRNLGLVDKKADFFGKIVIGNNVNIGWDAIIMPGVQIGDNCIIAAGAIVTKNVPDNSVAVGIPARVLESVQEYAHKKKNSCVLTKNMTSEEKKAYLEQIDF